MIDSWCTSESVRQNDHSTRLVPVFLSSRKKTPWRTIQGISLDTLCRRSDVTLRGLHEQSTRSKLNPWETNMAAAQPVSGVITSLKA